MILPNISKILRSTKIQDLEDARLRLLELYAKGKGTKYELRTIKYQMDMIAKRIQQLRARTARYQKQQRQSKELLLVKVFKEGMRYKKAIEEPKVEDTIIEETQPKPQYPLTEYEQLRLEGHSNEEATRLLRERREQRDRETAQQQAAEIGINMPITDTEVINNDDELIMGLPPEEI